MASLRQTLLRFVYPIFQKYTRTGKRGLVLKNNQNALPKAPIYEHKAVLNNGKELDFSSFLGKKLLIVNTASNCGYTGQYAELQSLHEKMGDKLAIIAFPSNDFKEQEKGNDADIASFCQLNYGVTFPIAKKAVVIKKEHQEPLFQWLSSPEVNGWCKRYPDWNFSKYLIDENGVLTHYFGPSVSPLEKVFLEAIEKPS